jgi:hypothetical protein
VIVSGTTALTAGQSIQFRATANVSNGTAKACGDAAAWQSSNTNVATVGSAGMVTAVTPGQADISATCDGVTGSVRVTISAATYALSGTIREGTTPLAQVRVEILNGENAGKQATSDGTGWYRMTGLAPGSFSVKASRAGYDPVTRTVTVSSGNVTLDFSLLKTAS